MFEINTMIVARRWTMLGGLFLCLLACLEHDDASRVEARHTYFTLTEDDLGRRDYMVANGNPMKGLIANPEFYHDPNVTSIDSSMDIYYVPVGNVMHDDPDVVGFDAAFNWTYVEDRLDASSAKGRHVILTFAVHYPGQPLSLPGHLEGSDKVQLHWYEEFMGGGLTPDYGGEPLLSALVNFVVALGRQYDGDNRIAFIHLGLLGFWGEWHTYPLLGLVPDHAKVQVADAYRNSFNVTKLQARYPDRVMHSFGYYDGSFAHSTLDGEANGGVDQDYFFWPMVEQEGHASFWRATPMGGETRPELQQIIFEDWYPRRTHMHQDFEEALKVTHASYMLHSDAFIEGGYNGNKLINAQRGHALLGYNFVVTLISAIAQDFMAGTIDLEITVEQTGVAPFYYPLALALDCPGLPSPLKVDGLDGIIDQGVSTIFTISDVPATWECLQDISISMDSPMLLPGRRMKFSQGSGAVNIKIPMPSRLLLQAVYGSGRSDDDDAEVVIVRQATADDAGKRSVPARQLPLLTGVDDLAVKVSFSYLASRLNETEQWFPLMDGDVVMIPEFGLSVAALLDNDNGTSSIWFSYGTGEMHIDTIPPYILSGNNYLASSGVKELIVTVFVDGRISTVTKLAFVALATSIGVTMMKNPISAGKKRSVGVDDAETKHKPKAINYDAHGFNTPFAPSLLQMVSLERMFATTTEDVRVGEDAVEDFEISSTQAKSSTALLTRTAGLIVPVWCLLLMIYLR